MSEEQINSSEKRRLEGRAREVVAGVQSRREGIERAAAAAKGRPAHPITDRATMAFAASLVHAVASDPDMPEFTVAILKIITESFTDLVDREDNHPLSHLGVGGLRNLAEAEKEARVELERQLLVAREHNKATQALLDRERDLGSDLRLRITHLEESLNKVIAAGDDPAVPFLAEAWRTGFVAAFEHERQKQPRARTTTIAMNAAIAANTAVLQACCSDDDKAPMGVLIGKGLA